MLRLLLHADLLESLLLRTLLSGLLLQDLLPCEAMAVGMLRVPGLLVIWRGVMQNLIRPGKNPGF